MHRPFDAMAAVFVATCFLIAAGYIAIPWLVFRYLPLTRIVLFWGGGFLITGAVTYIALGLLIRHNVGWFWTAEFASQAVCTWGFLLGFHRMLRAANGRRAVKVPARCRHGEATAQESP